jgi:hypothetical protein
MAGSVVPLAFIRTWYEVRIRCQRSPIISKDDSILLLDYSNSGRLPGKYCPIKSGNHPLPPGIVAPLE